MSEPLGTPSLQEVVSVLDAAYDPRWAQPWDAVGLVLGDPDQQVRRVLFAVDPVDPVVAEACAWNADLLVTHHPLFLRGVHGFPTTTPKGRRAHRLVRAGIALHTAHTNADTADPGVSDALAAALGVRDLQPLRPEPADPVDKIVTFVPDEHADLLVDVLAAAGAGSIGAYERCAWTTRGTGTFKPTSDARPAVSPMGEVKAVAETRVEMVLPRRRRAEVIAALRSGHPYEEPEYDVFELTAAPGRRGLGRVGTLAESVSFATFLDRTASALPGHPAGLRAAGEPRRPVRTVAVCGGAGDDLLDAARASGADVYLTADLRHHPASESLEQGGPMLVDVGHWASEWPWLTHAAARLVSGLRDRGATVETRVSAIVTDPWTAHRPLTT